MITEHKEAIKIYDGITYIDEDLIEELQSVLEEGATDSMKKGMGNFNKIVIPAIVVVCIIFAFVSVVMDLPTLRNMLPPGTALTFFIIPV